MPDKERQDERRVENLNEGLTTLGTKSFYGYVRRDGLDLIIRLPYVSGERYFAELKQRCSSCGQVLP